MFDDRIVVESPGNLPSIVRLNNMRQVHFSRNPKIAAFLHEYDYVQEFGEGVDRMYREMERAGLPEPEYRDIAFMLNATIRNGANIGTKNGANGTNNGTNPDAHDLGLYMNLSEHELLVLDYVKVHPNASTKKVAQSLPISLRTVQRCIASLEGNGIIKREGNRKNTKWIILE